jgi:hypothetical protein
MPTARVEIFVNSLFNRGTASISGVDFSAGELASRLPGLDFTLMNAAFSGFSDLRIRQLVHAAGVTYRLSGQVLLNGAVEYHDYKDTQPYLFDTTGRRAFAHAGLSWIF